VVTYLSIILLIIINKVLIKVTLNKVIAGLQGIKTFALCACSEVVYWLIKAAVLSGGKRGDYQCCLFCIRQVSARFSISRQSGWRRVWFGWWLVDGSAFDELHP